MKPLNYPGLRQVSLLFMLMIAFAGAYAHEGSVKGRALDADTRQPVEDVLVFMEEKNIHTHSDAQGEWSFGKLEAGTYTLVLSHIGYRKETVTVQVKADESTFLETAFVPADLQLPEVSIRAGQGKNLSSISAVDVRLRPMNSAQDALRIVPGLFIAQHAGGGKAEQIFLRGFDIDHGTDVNISVDGMPVNMVSHAHGQGYADLHFLIPELIQRIDFEKGPYNAQYGNLATAGYVAFRTRDALESSSFKLEAGQYNTLRAVGMLNLLDGSKDRSAYIASEFLFSDGYFESPQNFDRINLFGKYHAKIGSGTQLTLSGSTFRSQWDASGQIPDRAVLAGLISRFGSIDDTEGGNTQRHNANLQLSTRLADGSTVTNQLYYSRYLFELYSNFTFFLEDSVNGDQIRQKEARDIFGYRGSWANSWAWGQQKLKAEGGIGIRHDETSDSELSHSRNRTETLDRLAYGDISETNAYAYASATLELGDRFSTQAALRYDQFRYQYQNQLTATYDNISTTKGVFSPKLNLSYILSPRLRLYLNNGIGFNSNDTRVVLAGTASQVLPRAFGSDLGIVAKPFDRLLVQAAVWGLLMEQEFVYVGDAGIVEPGGSSRRSGVDVSLRYQVLDWLYGDVDVTFARPRSVEDEALVYIPLAPTFSSIGGLSARAGRVEGSLRYRYLGDRSANGDYSLSAEGYFLLDAVVNY
ncbi:MAG: TonB-dependent receptor, partial [Bacteroidetes bacterium]